MGAKKNCRICNKPYKPKKGDKPRGLCKKCQALKPHERWAKAMRNPALAERYRKGVELMTGR